MGGNIQGRLWPRNEDEKARALEAGYNLEKVWKCYADVYQSFWLASGSQDAT